MRKLILLLLFVICFISELGFASSALYNTTMLNDTFENGNFNLWTDNGVTDWTLSTTRSVSPTNSALADLNTNDLLSDNLNMSDASAIYISFSYWDTGIDDKDNVFLNYWNGTAYKNILELGMQTEGRWNTFYAKITDSQYFKDGFHIYVEGSSIDSGENLWIDDVLILKEKNASIAPVISNITSSNLRIKGGEIITIYANTTSHGVNDSENDTLYLYCDTTNAPTAVNTDCTGGTTSDSARPYVLTCTFATAQTSANYTEYCRVYDGTSYSPAVNLTYETDYTPPTTTITSVAGDTIASYFDNLNDGRTNIIINGEASMVCRWSSSDVAYSVMSNDCSISETSANCSVTDALTQGFLTRYVACADNLTNGQNSSTNLDIQFYLDYTAPTTSDNSNILVQAPNYSVTISENDNVDSDPLTYYCTSASLGCTPGTLIDNLGFISYTSLNRGVNYLRYYSIDDAGNSQTIVNKTININQLPVFLSANDNTIIIKGGNSVNVSTISYDSDSGQEITLFVCNSSGASLNGCNGGHYCNITGTSNLSCIFTSELDNNNHTWYAYVFDELGEEANNNSLTGTYTTDSTVPTITLNNPSNASTIPGNSITITIISNEALTNAWYSLNNENNITMANSSLYVYTHSNTSIANGNYNLSIWANDSYGNIGSLLENYFIIDSTANDTTSPVITIWSPQNNTYYTSASVLLNITSDEALNWAGYRLDSEAIVNLANVSTTNWNKTITLTEGTHNITFYANDSSSNNNSANKSIGLFIDLTNPSVDQFSCTDANDSQNVVCNANVSDAMGLNYVIISYNSTGTWQNSSQLSLNGTSSSLSYSIGAGNTSVGVFGAEIYLYDLSGRNNLTSSDLITINDDSFPTISNITYYPNTTANLDPEIRIKVNATIVENYNISEIILMWTNLSDGIWRSVPMINLTAINYQSSTNTIFNASFIPGNGTYAFKINATDSAGNSNISNNLTLVVANETQFLNSTDINNIKSFSDSQRSSNNTLGTIYINNTGDTAFNLNISIISSIANRFNINYTNDDNSSYLILPGENLSILILVNTTGLTGLNLYNISLVSEAGNTDFEKNLYIQSTEAPYIVTNIIKYSSTVIKGQRDIELIASVSNYGTQDAQNVVLIWTLPSGFSLISGNLSRNLGNLPIGLSSTNTISVLVDSTAADSIVNITANASATGNLNSLDYKEVTIGSPVTIIQSSVTGGGGGSSGGGGGISDKIVYNKIIELVRGKEDSFKIEIYNPFSNLTLNNIVINFTGLLSKYIRTEPLIVQGINPKERINLTVNLKIPSYKGSYEEQELNAYITGDKNNNGKKDYAETQKILLIIEEISREDTIINLEKAQEAIKLMSENQFNTKEIQDLIKSAQERLEKRRNKEAFDFSEQILEINRTAFSASDLISRVTQALNNPRKMDLISGDAVIDYGIIQTGRVIFDSESTKEILDMANAAFERGDYKTAFERAKSAQVMLILERKGNFGLFLYLYWYFVIAGFILLSILGIVGTKIHQRNSISKRIIDLNREEDNISVLIKEAQKTYFNGKISENDYYKIMSQHQAKISEIKKVRTNLRNKQIKLLKGRELIKELDNEKNQVENLIKRLQNDFYVQKKISEPEYKGQFQILNERLAEIEEERSTMHIMERSHPINHSREYAKAKSGIFAKIFKGIKNIFTYPYYSLKRIKYRLDTNNEGKTREKIKNMLNKK